MTDPIRILVGCAANNEDIESQLVLEHTLRKHASMPIEIEWMQLSRDPASFWYSDPQQGLGWNNTGWATPFSAFRWGIPARCNFEGRAIYMDSDMIVRGDIAELWNEPIPDGKVIVAKGDGRFCVALFDCAKAQPIAIDIERLRRDPKAYRDQRAPYHQRTQKFTTGNWNCLDGENYQTLDAPEIKCLHYTAIPTQPQLKYAVERLKADGQVHWFKGVVHPHWRADIREWFDREYFEAGGAAEAKKYEVPVFGSYGTGSSGGGLLKARDVHDVQHMIRRKAFGGARK